MLSALVDETNSNFQVLGIILDSQSVGEATCQWKRFMFEHVKLRSVLKRTASKDIHEFS